jgi:hypothetical protein
MSVHREKSGIAEFLVFIHSPVPRNNIVVSETGPSSVLR